MAHKKSAMPFNAHSKRWKRRNTFGTPVCHKLHHAQSVCVTKRQSRWLPFTVHLSLIIVVLVIPIWVSYAFLGYARNNSDASLVRISPRTDGKDTKIKWNNGSWEWKICKKEAFYLEDNRKMPIFATSNIKFGYPGRIPRGVRPYRYCPIYREPSFKR